jgi:ABC-2 type transport system permease protein
MTDAGVLRLLEPKWRTGLARLRQGRSGNGGRAVAVLSLGATFWLIAFLVLRRVLLTAKAAPEIGELLPPKLLGIAMLTFASILLLSNIITALSTFFLSKELDALIASPVDWLKLYLAKLLETTLYSSWMVILLAVPLFAAYGTVLDGGPLFPLVVIGALIPFLLLPAVIGAAVTLLLVNIFPARRARDLLGLVAIGAAGLAVVVLRVLRPEQLARPEGFESLLDFLVMLRTPSSSWLPTEWVVQMTMNWLTQIADPLPIVLLWTTAAAFVVLGAMLHRSLYWTGFTKAQEGAQRFVQGDGWLGASSRLLQRASPQRREFVLKDARLFFRDTTQWSQLILLGVLLIVYLFNIQALPLFTGEKVSFYIVTLVTFLNLALAGFVLAAVAARFVFPAISLEGRQMWLLRSSPLDMRTLLASKYWSGVVPLLAVAVILSVATNTILQATPFMMLLSVLTITGFTFATCGLALCFGTLYPQFDTENAAQIPTSFGGLVYMLASVLLLVALIALEARPVLEYVQAFRAGTPEQATAGTVLPLLGAAALCAVTTVVSLRVALARLEAQEW